MIIIVKTVDISTNEFFSFHPQFALKQFFHAAVVGAGAAADWIVIQVDGPEPRKPIERVAGDALNFGALHDQRLQSVSDSGHKAVCPEHAHILQVAADYCRN